MRRREHSGSNNSKKNNTNELGVNKTNAIEMTPSINSKRRTHSEMERGFVRSSFTLAAEKLASTIDFDKACLSSSMKVNKSSEDLQNYDHQLASDSSQKSSSSSEDEEKQPLIKKRRSPSYSNPSPQQETDNSSNNDNDPSPAGGFRSSIHSAFPSIDNLHLPNIPENLRLSQLSEFGQNIGQNLQQNLPHIDMSQLGSNLNLNNLNVSFNVENIDFSQLPVEIQLALDDALLGWTHLSSIAMGHVMLPLLVFYTVRQASKVVLDKTVTTLAEWSIQDDAAALEEAPHLEGEFGVAVEAVLVSSTTHALLGAVAAIAAFRVIRNRRKVWFRYAYGSKGYSTCEEGRRRRAAVLNADKHNPLLLNGDATTTQSTWTSRVVSNYKRKRHKKKLQKASDRFERHLTGRKTPPSSSRSASMDHVSGSSKSASPLAVISGPNSKLNVRKQRFWQNKTNDYASTATTTTETESHYDLSSSSEDDEDEDLLLEQQPKDTVAHDAVSIPRIHNVPYAHGGFFGAAPFFLADQKWVSILRELLPDVYVEISKRVGGGYLYKDSMDASKLIHWAENNPVVAAYGVVTDLQIKQDLAKKEEQSQQYGSAFPSSEVTNGLDRKRSALTIHTSNLGDNSSSNIIDHFYQAANSNSNLFIEETDGKTSSTNSPTPKGKPNVVIPNLEWDIFVNPQLVRRVEAVLDAMDRYVISKSEASSTKASSSQQGGSSSTKSEVEDEEYDDKDCGSNEAAALLADHDHNSERSSSMVGINNLCGNGIGDTTTSLCADCMGQKDPSDGKAFEGFFTEEDNSNNPTTNQSDSKKPSAAQLALHDWKNDPVIRYLERELEKRTQELTDRLLIAHGNVLQLMMEQAGILKDWNYSRVQRTRRTLGGGMYARQWMAVFAESLRLGMKPVNCNEKRKTHRRTNSTPNSVRIKTTGAQQLRSKHKRSSTSLGIGDVGVNSLYDDSNGNSSIGVGMPETLPPMCNDSDEEPFVYPEEEIHIDDDSDDDSLIEHSDRSLEDDHNNQCTCSPRCYIDSTMSESLNLIEKITKTKQPIGILLDLKSRHVPKRVLSLMVRSLQAAGIRVVGIASFEISEIRGVSSCNTPHPVCDPFKTVAPMSPTSPKENRLTLDAPPRIIPTKEILMVHSAGDLQAACDDGLVRPGDHVFFNGGSLILDSARSSTLKTLAGFFFDMCVCGFYSTFDPCAIEEGYRIQSYGYACGSMDAMETVDCFSSAANPNDPSTTPWSSAATGPHKRKNAHHYHHHVEDEDHYNARALDNIGVDDDDTLLLTRTNSEDTAEMNAVMKTLADYKKHYGFSMGLYLQEFSIDEAAARLLIDLVNQNPQLYDLGLAWGGINGMTVHGIQPGRFTSTDGYWNQRRLGKVWKDPVF